MDTPNNSLLAIHMGESFYRLSPLLQKAHLGKTRLTGTVQVKQGNVLSRVLCLAFPFPKESEQANLTVHCEHTKDTMTWKRNFNGRLMESSFRRKGDYLIENLGPLALTFKAIEHDGKLNHQFVKTRFFRIPMPNFLSPQVTAWEQERDGQYHFFVAVTMLFIGPVISYSGVLTVEPA